MRRTWIGLAVVAVGSLAILWLTPIPLGVPSEWEWRRIPVSTREWSVLLLSAISALAVGGIYVGLAAIGAHRIDRTSTLQTAVWLSGLCAAGFGWLWVVQDSPARTEHTTAKWFWVLYYPGTEGYYDEARHRMNDVPSYLADYQRRMADGDYLHFGTHPPGLILFHRALINLCEASPGLRDFLVQTQSTAFRDAADATEQAEKNGLRPVTPTDRAAVWLAALITQAVAVATIVPLYLLVRRTQSKVTSWWTAALWPLVPSLAIFLPKSDALFPFLGVLFTWLWLEGFRRGSLRTCRWPDACFGCRC